MCNERERMKKYKEKINKYLFFIDYYMIQEEWVSQEKIVSVHKKKIRKEIEEKLQKVWVKKEDYRKFEIQDEEDYAKMHREIKEMIKNSLKKTAPEAKNIKYYLTPIAENNLIESIESNRK